MSSNSLGVGAWDVFVVIISDNYFFSYSTSHVYPHDFVSKKNSNLPLSQTYRKCQQLKIITNYIIVYIQSNNE